MRTAYLACRGFTSVELMVSIGLFTIIVGVAVGGLVQAFKTQRQIAALVAVSNNGSLTIEQMVREIRTGFDFSWSPATPGELTFTNATGERVSFRFQGVAIERSDGSALGFQPISAENVVVEYLEFLVFETPVHPPRVTIFLGMKPKERSVSGAVMNLETTVSPRF